ncbi:MAG: hypothetical protein SWQ30_10030 [Thermodesulfobacteriota bacterium]|nr:hypothetical protein [Thermodesulfobacteriota bacterium]
MSFDGFQGGKFPVSYPYKGGKETTGEVSKSFQKFPSKYKGLFASLVNKYKALKANHRKTSFQKFPEKFPEKSFLSFLRVSMKVSIFLIPKWPHYHALGGAFFETTRGHSLTQ